MAVSTFCFSSVTWPPVAAPPAGKSVRCTPCAHMRLLRNSKLIENFQSNETDPVLPQEPILTAVEEDLQHCQNIAAMGR